MMMDKLYLYLVAILIILAISVVVSLAPAIGGPSQEFSSDLECEYATNTYEFTNSTRDGDVFNVTAPGWLWTTEECYEFDSDGNYSCTQVNVSSDSSAEASASALTNVINSESSIVEASNESLRIKLTSLKCGDGGNEVEVESSCDLMEV